MNIKVKGQKLVMVTSFKFLRAIFSKVLEGNDLYSFAQTTAALTKLEPIQKKKKYNNIFFEAKTILMRSTVVAIFRYSCVSLTLTEVQQYGKQHRHLR